MPRSTVTGSFGRGSRNDEITGKSRSLRGVLEPQTSEENALMLQRAGFTHLDTVFRWPGWEGVIARV